MRLLHLTGEDLTALGTGSLVVLDHPAAFWIHGPGADTCLQGLLTNDVVRPGDGSLIYGALLTAKGAIVVDYWVIRAGGGFLLLADAAGRDPSVDLFRRQLPPRLARTTDLTGRVAVLWVLGPADAAERDAIGLLTAQGWAGSAQALAPGRAVCLTSGEDKLWLARAPATAPFSALVAGPAAVIEALGASLLALGHRPGSFAQLHVARVLAGFPTLGAEIGERTLPQEVRYDDIDGVSYDKGCYVGQETVARIHFRGHPNWVLRGVEPIAAPTPADSHDETLTADGKTVGRLTTLVAPDGTPRFGLASVRREIEVGAELASGIGPVRVVQLPFPKPA
jgi:folate-binding protein YgfZ